MDTKEDYTGKTINTHKASFLRAIPMNYIEKRDPASSWLLDLHAHITSFKKAPSIEIKRKSNRKLNSSYHVRNKQ